MCLVVLKLRGEVSRCQGSIADAELSRGSCLWSLQVPEEALWQRLPFGPSLPFKFNRHMEVNAFTFFSCRVLTLEPNFIGYWKVLRSCQAFLMSMTQRILWNP